ncbi:MAG: hypothetical protein AAGF12_01160 [Myxococcota bacterium]
MDEGDVARTLEKFWSGTVTWQADAKVALFDVAGVPIDVPVLVAQTSVGEEARVKAEFEEDPETVGNHRGLYISEAGVHAQGRVSRAPRGATLLETHVVRPDRAYQELSSIVHRRLRLGTFVEELSARVLDGDRPFINWPAPMAIPPELGLQARIQWLGQFLVGRQREGDASIARAAAHCSAWIDALDNPMARLAAFHSVVCSAEEVGDVPPESAVAQLPAWLVLPISMRATEILEKRVEGIGESWAQYLEPVLTELDSVGAPRVIKHQLYALYRQPEAPPRFWKVAMWTNGPEQVIRGALDSRVVPAPNVWTELVADALPLVDDPSLTDDEAWAAIERLEWTRDRSYENTRRRFSGSAQDAARIAARIEVFVNVMKSAIEGAEKEVGQIARGDDGFLDLCFDIVGGGRADFERVLADPGSARDRPLHESFAYVLPPYHWSSEELEARLAEGESFVRDDRLGWGVRVEGGVVYRAGMIPN